MMNHILKRYRIHALLISILVLALLVVKGVLECQFAKWITFCEKHPSGQVELMIAVGGLCLIIAAFNSAIGLSVYWAFSAFFNMDSTRRQPNPWVVLLLAIVITKLLQDFDSHHCTRLLEISKNIFIVFVPGAVYAIYTFHYGTVERPRLRWDLLTISMVASPWLFAGLNYFFQNPSVTTLAFPLAVLRSLAIGIHEELSFRGILFRAFQGRSMVQYTIVSAIAFGLLHWHLGYQGVFACMLIGCCYDMARVAGTPLILLIVCHALLDFKLVQVDFNSKLFSVYPVRQLSLMVYPNQSLMFVYNLFSVLFVVVVVLALAIFAAFLMRKADWMTTGAGATAGNKRDLPS